MRLKSSSQVYGLNAENKCAHLSLLFDLHTGVRSYDFTKVGNRGRGYFIGCVVSSRREVYLKQIYRMTTGISFRDRATFKFAMPTELPWEFPCSMIAKSLQPQSTRQLLWAVGKRNYTLTHTVHAQHVHSQLL